MIATDQESAECVSVRKTPFAATQLQLQDALSTSVHELYLVLATSE